MNTLFWLAVTLSVIGYALFFLQILSLWVVKKGWAGTPIQISVVRRHGIVYLVNFWWLFLGIIASVAAVTL